MPGMYIFIFHHNMARCFIFCFRNYIPGLHVPTVLPFGQSLVLGYCMQ